MRETRVAQVSLFENYSKHQFGTRFRLRALSDVLDQHWQPSYQICSLFLVPILYESYD